MTLRIRRIDCASDDAERAIAALRAELSPRGNVVSPEGRARTIAAFGEPLEPRQVVERICDDVAARGLDAVLDYGRRLDGAELDSGRIRVSRDELEDAHRRADPAYLETIGRVRANILAYQRAILHRDVRLERGPGIELGLLYRPLRRVGVCIPGGAAAYPSSLLMTVVPAQAAGVAEIAVVVPPTRFGGFNDDILAACHALGISEVYRIGGAQGVAALAYGLGGDRARAGGQDRRAGQPVRRPGQAARLRHGGHRQHRRAQRGRRDRRRHGPARVPGRRPDQPGRAFAGRQHPARPGRPSLIDRVVAALEDQLGRLSRGGLARDSLERFGALVLARDEDEAIAPLQPDRARAPARLDRRPGAAGPPADRRRRDLPGPRHAGGRGRLRRRAVARAADRRHGAVGLGALGQRLPQAVEPDLALARGAGRAGARHPAAGRQGGARPRIG